jgi:DNA polymerase III delta prime subunit
MYESFINKYSPKSTHEFLGNQNNINDIKEWILSFEDATVSLKKNKLLKKNTKGRKKGTSNFSEEDKKHSVKKGNLLIYGDNGTGKSILINLILKELNFSVISINSYNEKRDDFIIKIKKIASMQKNQVLLIDELDALIQTNEKKNIDDLLKLNNYERFIPIIILSNGSHCKKLTGLKKMSNNIEILKCDKIVIKDFLFKICKNENININYMYLDNIIEKEQYDIRKLILFLEELKMNYSNVKITKNFIEHYINIVQSKDCTKDLFKITKKIMTTSLSTTECLKLCMIDDIFIPLMIYENYYKCLNYSNYSLIMSKFSYSDIIENYIYSDQTRDLLEILNILNCVIPVYYINKFKNNSFINIKYANDFNKTSIRKNKIKKNNSNNSIEEFIYTI